MDQTVEFSGDWRNEVETTPLTQVLRHLLGGGG
jgi:hypothetical protein